MSNTRLKSFLERILRLKEEQDAFNADIREVYAEAKAEGYDKTAMGQVVAHRRKVEKRGAAQVEEQNTLFDLYLNALDGETGTQVATHTHVAREANQSASKRIETAIGGRPK